MPLTGLLSPTHPAYLASRKFILSGDNPYYFSGSAASGVGGPHVGYNMIWPMSLVVQAMTSTSDDEVEILIDYLLFLISDFHLHIFVRTDRAMFTMASFKLSRNRIYARKFRRRRFR